ncbi:MAG: type II secretion system F family protein [Planctomycetes bacterium]|nr:type II secretion system F family protein [Planctomycetota bacterium]
MIFLIILAIFIVCAIIHNIRASRRENTAFIISTINSCLKQSLPLHQALEHAAMSAEGRQQRILYDISMMLGMSWPLGHSIHATYKCFSSRALGVIFAAERASQLPKAFESLQADMLELARARAMLKPMHPAYPIIVLAFAALILTALSLFVMPQFAAINSDMQIPHSESSIFLLNVWGGLKNFLANLCDSNDAMPFIMGFTLLLVVVLGIRLGIGMAVHNRDFLKTRLSLLFGDFLKWCLPILHRLELKRSQHSLVQCLRMSLRAGRTIDGAISDALLLDVNRMFRGRIARWLERVQKGEDVSASARSCRIGANIAWAFDNKVSGSNTIRILEMLENTLRQDCTFIAKTAGAIFWPMVTLGLAAIVLDVVYFSIFPYFNLMKFAVLTYMP